MDIRHLVALHEVAAQGSITGAAAVLNTSQPAITRALKLLEHQVGLPLLVRSHKGTTLTEAGEALDRHTRSILSELNRAREEMKSFRAFGAGKLAVGTMPAGSYTLIPQTLTRFQKLRPTVPVSIIETPTMLPGLVESRDLDLAVVSASLEHANSALVEETLLYDRVVIVARRSHPLMRRRKLQAADLADADWILPMVSGRPKHELESAFWRLGLQPPKRTAEIGSSRTIRTLLLSSDKIAPMLRLSLLDEENRDLLRVVPVDLQLPMRRMSVLFRKATSNPASVELFLSILRDVARELSVRIERSFGAHAP